MLTLTQPADQPLSQDDARKAGKSAARLKHLLNKDGQPLTSIMLHVSGERPGDDEEQVALPVATLPLLSTILSEMGHGKSVVVLATDAEVTTQQAADFFNVSRPYVVKLLEEGKIPFRPGLRPAQARFLLAGDLICFMR